jgi:hypothetical protein
LPVVQNAAAAVVLGDRRPAYSGFWRASSWNGHPPLPTMENVRTAGSASGLMTIGRRLGA